MSEQEKTLSQRLADIINKHALAPIAFAHSLAVEDAVILDALWRLNPSYIKDIHVFTLDTGRLDPASYQYIERIRHHYKMTLHVYTPAQQATATLMTQKGALSFYDSIENRKECCRIRKVEPLNRALKNTAAWIVGLRQSQSVTRADLQFSEIDDISTSRIKYAPLFDWSEQEVWAYATSHNIPTHKLHDAGYPSIGCAPCTRPVDDWVKGQDNTRIDIRSGRWWWENPDNKECGLHVK